MAEVADLTLKILQELRSEVRESRKETGDNLRLLHEQMQHSERGLDLRFRQMQSELETLIKMEIGGRLTHLETRLEQKIDDRLAVEIDTVVNS